MQAAPTNRAFRVRVISFLHRLVECLGAHMLPYLPDALSALMPPQTDRPDLVEVFTLVNQLITRYKAALQPLMASVRTCLKALPDRMQQSFQREWISVSSSAAQQFCKRVSETSCCRSSRRSSGECTSSCLRTGIGPVQRPSRRLRAAQVQPTPD